MPKGEKSKVAIQVAAWILRWALGSAFPRLRRRPARLARWLRREERLLGRLAPLRRVRRSLEIVVGVALVLGIWPRPVAWVAAALLLSFALTMTVALGIVAPVSYSVFSAFAGALLLAMISPRGSNAWSRKTV